MKIKATLSLLLVLISWSFSQLSAQKYSQHDIEKVKAFLRQGDNLEKIGFSPTDTLDWDTNYEYFFRMPFEWDIFEDIWHLTAFQMNYTSCGCSTQVLFSGDLDLEGCQYLKKIDPMGSHIESLNVSNCPSLEDIYFSNGTLKKINIANCPKLKNLQLDRNQFDFRNIPKKEDLGEDINYYFLPQNPKEIEKAYMVNIPHEFDDLGGTSYKWLDSDGNILTEGKDYIIDNGKITFFKETKSRIRCEATNSAFPGLTITSDYTSVVITTTIEYNPNDVEKLKAFLKCGDNAGFFAADIKKDDNIWLPKTSNIEWIISNYEYRLKGISFTEDTFRPLEGKLDFSGCSELVYVNFSFIYKLPEYNFAGCSELQTLIASGGNSSPANLSGCKKLSKLSISGIRKKVDLSDCIGLKDISLSGAFEKIDLSKQSKLQTLSLSGKLSEIDLTNNVQLTTIDLSNNALTSLNLTQQTKATNIIANDNKLTNIELPQGVSLSKLNLSNNNLNNHLNLSVIEYIYDLDISNNPLITKLGASMLPDRVSHLTAKNHNIEEADFSKISSIRNIILTSGKLKKLKLHPQVSIAKLEVSINQIKSLDDISNLSDIAELYILNNQLTEVDVAKLPKTQILNIAGNNVSELHIPKNSNIRGFSLYENCLNFNNLPRYQQFPQMTYADYLEIKNQKAEIKESYTLEDAVIDLSYLGGTEYRWFGRFSEWGDQPNSSFYTISNGVTTFHKKTAGKVYCEITNPNFPKTKIITNETNIRSNLESIESSTLDSQVEVYSNTAGTITLVAPIDAQYEVFNLSGDAIARGTVNKSEETIQVSQSSGLYLVKVQSNEASTTRKVIVK